MIYHMSFSEQNQLICLSNFIHFNKLQYVTKPVIPRDECVRPKTDWAPNQITASMICAGDADGGEATCEGDSGKGTILHQT